jgi:hypothetical protein
MKIRTLGISSALLIASLALCNAEDDAIALDKTPAAVQQAIKSTVGDGKIREIETETKAGVTTYEVAYTSTTGEKFEAVISAAGEVLKSGTDKDKEEKGEKKEKDGEDKD